MSEKEIEVSLTSAEADEEVARLKNIFPIVRLLDADQVEHEMNCLLCGDETPCMRKVCSQLLQTHGNAKRLLQLGSEQHKVNARYVEVDGVPHIMLYAASVEHENRVDRNELYIDVLSGLYNRRFYEDEIKRERLFAGVAVIDLDDFKLVNDSLGHHAGDLALRAAAQTMLGCIRDTDILIRYGGDEFVLVIPNIDSVTFSRRLRAISLAISQTCVPGNEQAYLSSSIGGVLSKGRTVEEAVRQADRLMYLAKQQSNSVLTDEDPIEEVDSCKPTLLIVDDSELNRDILKEMLKDDYEILEADNGYQGVELIREHGSDISLVLLDIIMEGMSGFDVLSAMVRSGWIENIPVIMISSEDSDEAVLRAYELGASDYIARPFDIRIVRQRVSNIMRLYARQRRLSSMLAQQYYERERTSNVLINIMGGAMEMRNGESGPHVLHVRNLTEILLDCLVKKTGRYGITSLARSMTVMCSALHDIGKLAIPDSILNKPGRLTDEEFEVMKSHTVLGSNMLDNLTMYNDNPVLLQTARDICRHHHERWDGGGYPDQLKGDDIPISAQVVSLADVYDALTSDRVYKKAIPHDEAMRMIINGECGQFNPLLIECLLESEDRIRRELDVPALTPPPIASKAISSSKEN